MIDKVQKYLCLSIALYLFACIAHDAVIYHDMRAENKIRLEREAQMRKIFSSRATVLAQMADKYEIPGATRNGTETLMKQIK